MLIGNSDSATEDREHLRVTLHHNLFDGIGQRTPRVRFGQVHVYNNVYRVDRDTNYRSSWGAGVESQLYAENNYFEMSTSFGPFEVIDGKKGTRMTASRQLLAREGPVCPTDFLALWNAQFDPDLKPDAGWTPTLYGRPRRLRPVEVARAGADESRPRTGPTTIRRKDHSQVNRAVGRDATFAARSRPSFDDHSSEYFFALPRALSAGYLSAFFRSCRARPRAGSRRACPRAAPGSSGRRPFPRAPSASSAGRQRCATRSSVSHWKRSSSSAASTASAEARFLGLWN